MNGYAVYEVARERIAQQQRDARQAGRARAQRAAARAARRAKKGAREAIATPVIPDFAHEMFDVARDAVPRPRQEAGRGRHARTSH
jgi:hypothetical protein